jgi:hypothetical protein
MSYFSMSEYKFLKNVKSSNSKKKYTAILQNKKTGRMKKINYGSSTNQQFKDSTGLGVYTSKNHGDSVKRASYKARHNGFIRSGFFSAGYFSMKYLW